MKYKTYKIIAEFEMQIRDQALVAQNPESVAAAARHYLKQNLTAQFGRGGYRFDISTIHADATDATDAAQPA